ncbi:MAG: hypothetical protein JKY54_14965, partial [Flavobacteriales bacterium]|nr:hypothetical protein [Flavobacteriales bacterium]
MTLLFGVFMYTSSFAQPGNNLCANATSLPCGTTSLAGTTVGTTNIADGTGCSVGNYGVWYTFAGDGQITTISCVGNFDQEMDIVSGSCGSLSSIACVDGSGSGGSETYTFTSTIGTTYYVYISHYNNSSSTTGTFTITRTCIAAPANDLCANATTLACGTTNLAGSTIGTVNIAHGTGCSVSSYGVWYTFAGDGQITTISTTATSGWDHEMNVTSGSCGSLTALVCEDNSGSNGTESYTFTSVVGTTYYVYVAYFLSGSSTTGDFTITRTCTPAPTNDLCANASTLACGTTNLAGSTVGTINMAHGTGCSVSNYGVWYTFVGDGQITTISSTATSGWDHEINIASGSCGSLTALVCEDNAGSNGTESYTFTSVVGTTYYVYVAYYVSGSTTGDFTITRTCTPAPTNDLCANAITLPCATSNLA